MDFFWSIFTVANFVQNLVWAVILGVAGRVLLWVFKKTNVREKWYWLSVPVFIFLLLMVIGALVHPMPYVVAKVQQVNVGVSAQPTDGAGNPLPGRIEGTPIVLVVSVANWGSATTLHDWRLSVVVPGQDPIFPKIQKLPDTLTMGQGFRYFAKDALYNKVAERPLERGATAVGILFFLVNADQRDIDRAGVLYRLSYRDYMDNERHVIQPLKINDGRELMYYPGLSDPTTTQ